MSKHTLKNRLRELMAVKGRRENRYISQRQLAEETGISKVTIDRWARNEVSRMDETTIITLCEYFGIQPGELIVMEVKGNDTPELKTPLLATA